jgi:hypothetical protein
MFIPIFTPMGEHSILFRIMEGANSEFHPKGRTKGRIKITPEGQLCP